MLCQAADAHAVLATVISTSAAVVLHVPTNPYVAVGYVCVLKKGRHRERENTVKYSSDLRKTSHVVKCNFSRTELHNSKVARYELKLLFLPCVLKWTSPSSKSIY